MLGGTVPDLPIGVGLGVSNGAQAAEVASYADAVIVGSAFVRTLLDAGTDRAAGLFAIALSLQGPGNVFLGGIVNLVTAEIRLPAPEGEDELTAGQLPEEQSLMLTGDLNAATVEWTIQWRVNDPQAYLFAFYDRDDEHMFERVIRTATAIARLGLVVVSESPTCGPSTVSSRNTWPAGTSQAFPVRIGIVKLSTSSRPGDPILISKTGTRTRTATTR